MVSAPNTESTLSVTGSTVSVDNANNTGINKTSTAISTNILILVNGKAVGAVQSISINENRTITPVKEIGTDGIIDSVPTSSTTISGNCTRIRFDKLRIAEAFGRNFIHVASQVYPFDIVILDKQKRDAQSQIATVIKNVWINSISYTYSADSWIISDQMGWTAETIFSTMNGGQVAVGGERRLIPTPPIQMGNSITDIEAFTDTGRNGRRGSLDAPGLIDLAIDNTLF